MFYLSFFISEKYTILEELGYLMDSATDRNSPFLASKLISWLNYAVFTNLSIRQLLSYSSSLKLDCSASDC
jgi:hypothetical protein